MFKIRYGKIKRSPVSSSPFFQPLSSPPPKMFPRKLENMPKFKIRSFRAFVMKLPFLQHHLQFNPYWIEFQLHTV